MAKFLDKKEQVYDLRVTSYGHHLMSIGEFDPVYFAFFDDNILYDKRYASGSASASIEQQNSIDNRIKNETQYIESLVTFTNVETYVAQNSGELFDPLTANLTREQRFPRKDAYRYEMAIGDSYLDGPQNAAPAWKILALQSLISSSQVESALTGTLIPQLNIVANYYKKIVEGTFEYNPSSIRSLNDETAVFLDNKKIVLESEDPLLYVEEMNTDLLVKNFDIEVYSYVVTGSNAATMATGSNVDTLERKFFRKDIPQIENGFMISPTKETVLVDEITTGSVEYYFDVLVDQEIEQNLACKGALAFDKKSYYIDLDFDCEQEQEESAFFDIYGSISEPEICLD